MIGKHTPGPWRIESRCVDKINYYVVVNERGAVIFDTLNSEVAEIHDDWDESDGTRFQYDEQGRVDMQLASAAPDLLSACEAVLEIYSEPCRFDHHGLCQTHHLRRNDFGEPECEFLLLREAVSKAKGLTR